MEPSELMQQQTPLQGTLRSVATSPDPVQQLASAALKQLLPHAFTAADQPSRAVDPVTKAQLQNAFKQAFLDFVQEAHLKAQPPMQYVAGKATEPALQRLLAAALLCCKLELMEPQTLCTLLDDLQEVFIAQHCLDIIAWLEQHVNILASELFTSVSVSLQQFTRLCNGLLKRLGKHQVVSKARLLMLIASITPLFDRSGVGITGTLAPPDAPKAEDVPDGALDSTGNAVNVLLYKKFWDLQGMLQDPLSVLASLDKWSTFKKELSAVLGELARSPATVEAARPGAAVVAAAAGFGTATAGGPSPMDASVSVGAASDEGAGTQCYLSSWKLFGLQLADSAFRRDFLVQVLVMLRTLLNPGKIPSETLKQKQRMEAIQLEEEVYKVLDATPRDGVRFSRAVREVLQREMSWVMWKKGGKEFVVPGKEAETPAAEPAGVRKPPSSCIDWSKPPVASLADAVAKAQAEAAETQARKRQRTADGLQQLHAASTSGRRYDTKGEPMDRPDKERKQAVQLLGKNCSSITYWAQCKVSDRSLADRPLLAGLKKVDQPDYPHAEALCSQVLREMDPGCGLDKEYKRIHEDGVFRWRVGRVVAHRMPEEQNVEQPEKLEEAMMHIFPQQVPAGYAELYKEREKQRLQKPQHAQAKSGAAPDRTNEASAVSQPATALAGDGKEAPAVVLKQEEASEAPVAAASNDETGGAVAASAAAAAADLDLDAADTVKSTRASTPGVEALAGDAVLQALAQEDQSNTGAMDIDNAD